MDDELELEREQEPEREKEPEPERGRDPMSGSLQKREDCMVMVPMSKAQKWDALAQALRDVPAGVWVELGTVPDDGHAGRPGRAREALRRRGVAAEVVGRVGRGPDDPERPWDGVRLYAWRIADGIADGEETR